jgi:hypothetical protein
MCIHNATMTAETCANCIDTARLMSGADKKPVKTKAVKKDKPKNPPEKK